MKMEDYLKLSEWFGHLAKNNHNNPVLTVGQYWDSLGNDELVLYKFLRRQRHIPSLNREWNEFEVQSRINQLESEFNANLSVNDPKNNNNKTKRK